MQQHSEDLARGLIATGHEVTLLTARVPPGGDMTALPGLAGVDWAVGDADCPVFFSPDWGAASVAAYVERAQRRPFDVIHSQAGGAKGLLDAGYGRQAPIVVAYHGNFHGYVKAELRAGWSHRPRGYGLARAAKHCFDQAVAHYGQGHARAYSDLEAIVVSRSQLRDTIRSQRLDSARTHVVMNGVDVDAFRPGADAGMRARWNVPPDAPLLMTLGRLASDKGTDRAVLAMRDLPERATLVVVGSGPEEGSLRALAARAGVGGRVRFVGSVSQVEVPAAMRAADVFWFPTTRDEAAPLVMPQAMASGLPVVASRIGGIPDYVGCPGEDAILIPAGDVVRLVAETRPLLDDAARRAALGAAARARVERHFSLAVMARQTVDVYRRAIARHLAVPSPPPPRARDGAPGS